MGFMTSDLIKGRIFVPAKPPAHSRKHPCKDCFSCQHCGDDRCGLCFYPNGPDQPEPPKKECAAEHDH
jgi:hypothetical protein